jgi:hypothetical protein
LESSRGGIQKSDLIVLGVTSALSVRPYGGWVRRTGEGTMSVKDLWGKMLPIAGITIGVIATLAWIGLLGYGLAKLL